MKTYYDLVNTKITKPTACCLGNFDGVHLGHQSLINVLLMNSQERNLESVILTFDPHPSRILNPCKCDPLILTLNQKERIIREFDIDHLIFAPFTQEFSKKSYEEFFYEVLVDKINAKVVVIGFDYKFGNKGEGNAKVLTELCLKNGIEPVILPPIMKDKKIISSTLVRDSVKAGDVKKAQSFMGRPFSVEGIVSKGDGVGSKLGFPTANISFKKDMLMPARGVYAVKVLWQGQVYKAVANVGNKPTFNGNDIKLEVHIIDFAKPLYGETIEVFFIDNLRKEVRFNKIEDLVKQVTKDMVNAKKLLKTI